MLHATIRVAVTGRTKTPIDSIASRLNTASSPVSAHASGIAVRRERDNSAHPTARLTSNGMPMTATTPNPFTPMRVPGPCVTSPEDETLDWYIGARNAPATRAAL